MPEIMGYLLAVTIVIMLAWVLALLKRKPAETENKQELQHIKIMLESLERSTRDEMQRLRVELMAITTENRKELSESLNQSNQRINLDLGRNREELRQTLESLSESISRRLQDLQTNLQIQTDKQREGLDKQMEQIRLSNEKKLEEMRHTVDEKLQQTLENRLGESFKQVSERLEQVYKGLGEMKVLATDVGDLKKVLSNVSVRGAMGELQLENIISQLLSPEQYEKQFKPRPRSPEVVEFAIKLPGKEENDRPVYLPVDSKFPLADYHLLVEAYEKGDLEGVETRRKALFQRIKASARDIRDKYINPPATTDFALLFLPIEGLFAEALRDPVLFESIQREMHVIITGPTTLAAILNSLQLGFRTLAIEKRSSEVWRILGGVKTEFGKFGALLDKTKQKIEEAHKNLSTATDRTRFIERKLQNVQELPTGDISIIPELPDSSPDEEDI